MPKARSCSGFMGKRDKGSQKGSLTKLAICQYYAQYVNFFTLTLAGIMEQVGKRIRQIRQWRGLSQQELADLIHKGRPLISHIETTGRVNRDTLRDICRVLQVSPQQLESGSEESLPGYTVFSQEEFLLLRAENEKLKNELKLKDEIIALLRARSSEKEGLKSRKKR